MERARATWTDERLDDLARGMVREFARLDGDMKAGFARVNSDINAGFTRVDEDIRSLRVELSGRIDAMQRTMIQLSGAMLAGILATLATVIATQL